MIDQKSWGVADKNRQEEFNHLSAAEKLTILRRTASMYPTNHIERIGYEREIERLVKHGNS